MMVRKGRLLIGALCVTVSDGLAVLSEPILVDADPQSQHWAALTTNCVPLGWTWNTNGDNVKLEVAGMQSALVTNFPGTTSEYLWQVFASNVSPVEDNYVLTVSLCEGNGQVIEAQTSRLAVVTGAFGAATVNTFADSQSWSKVKTNVVIPYAPSFAGALTNAAFAQLVIAKVGGAVQTNVFAAAAGYYGWEIHNSGWGYGTFELGLTFPETGATFLMAELLRRLDGTVIRVR